MSAPDTNTEDQEKRHRPSLWGIRGAMIFGALMLIGLIGFNIFNAGDSDAITNANTQGTVSTTVDTDVYEPGTNSTATPTATE
jgi:hypothetical protein